MRVNRRQVFVIGGGGTFDDLISGHSAGEHLFYAALTRNGFTPHSRRNLLARFRDFDIEQSPFVDLPEPRSRRWGQGLTADKFAANQRFEIG